MVGQDFYFNAAFFTLISQHGSVILNAYISEYGSLEDSQIASNAFANQRSHRYGPVCPLCVPPSPPLVLKEDALIFCLQAGPFLIIMGLRIQESCHPLTGRWKGGSF